MKYEAWISDTATLGMKGNRTVEIAAGGHREAYRLAQSECGSDEFVRGVNEIPSKEATYDPMEQSPGALSDEDDRMHHPEAYGLDR